MGVMCGGEELVRGNEVRVLGALLQVGVLVRAVRG